jgi:hypothetical protein
MVDPLGCRRPCTHGRQGHRRQPATSTPFKDASELQITGATKGRIAPAGGYGSHGERVHSIRKKSGELTELWLSGTKLISADELAAEMEGRYGDPSR